MFDIVAFPVTGFQQNCRILVESGSNHCVVVDPGGEADRIWESLTAKGLDLKEIWLTHSHLDHCGGVAGLLAHKQVPLLGHAIEQEMRARVRDICALYGMTGEAMDNCPEPSRYIKGGDVLTFASQDFEVRDTPGHSPGHVSLYCAAQKVALVGDALFAGSIGRTDLPGGNHAQLIESIQRELLTLPDDTRVLSGHGPDTTIGVERRGNPFLQ